MSGPGDQPDPAREAGGPPGLPRDASDLPAVIRDIDHHQIKQFMTRIKTAEQQIGEHIIRALQDPDTVAVLTAVVIGPDGTQQIVSAALDPETMSDVQKLLHAAEQQRDDEVPCVGFHCLLKKKDAKA